jgi:threonine aldolase
MSGLVDLRSDTVTRPTAAMRQAMFDAPLGDDVFGDDPTVRALEDRTADLLGMEAALFVPSGTMANQLALRAHGRAGDTVMAGRDAHIWRHETGALAALAGLQTLLFPTPTFTGADIRAHYTADGSYNTPTTILAVENTHNMGGGLPWDPAALTDVVTTAKSLGMLTHLDGARLWNAAVATNTSERTLATGFDSASVCLSKGLGAPVGSLVAGSKSFIQRCHRFRKMYGGGMRQSGLLAAAGLYALEHHRTRLATDHAHAKLLAESLARTKGITIPPVATNIVMIDFDHGSADAAVAAARAADVLVTAAGPRRIRAVTHLDVNRDDVLRAASVIAALAA